MAPPFRVPLAVNYQSPLASSPSRILDEPPGTEGRQICPGTISWAEYAGATAVIIDVQQAQSPSPWSRICAVWVDASASDADVQLLFNDLSTSVLIPARTEQLLPVSTNALNFVISSPQAVAADLVNFQVFNFNPRWLSVTPAYLTTAIALQAQSITASGLFPIITAPISGIVNGLTLSVDNFVGAAGGNTCSFSIQDGEGTPVILFNTRMTVAAAARVDFLSLVNAPSGLNLRFKNGLNLNYVLAGAAPATGDVFVNVYFR